MKYILTNDIRFILKNKKIMLLSYIIIIICFIITSKVLKLNIDNDFIAQIIGICLDLNDNYLYIFIYVLNIGMSIYLSILLFTKDISLGKECIFLRCKYSTWFIRKMMSIFLNSFLMKLLIYLFSFSIFSIGLSSFKIIFIDLIYIYCIETLSLIIYYIILKCKWLIYIIFMFLIFIIYKVNYFNFLTIKGIILLILISFMLLFTIAKYIFTNNYIVFFEEGS